MLKTRLVLGVIAGVILVLSSAAHSILGWKGLSRQIAAANVPADLTVNLMIGWEFGGMTMLVLGILMIGIFVRGLRGEIVPIFPPLVVGGAYLLFGIWALAVSNFNPFFFIFIVPAILLLVAAPQPKR